MRHKWQSEPRSIVSTCEACGLRRIRRWAYSHHWLEWQRPDGSYLGREWNNKTPACNGTPAGSRLTNVRDQ